MEKKIDLKDLKSKIDVRKKEMIDVARKLGESSGNEDAMPADQFLSGLLEAIRTGLPNKATNTLKEIENKIEISEGKTPTRTLDDLSLLQHVDTAREPAPIPQRPLLNAGQEYNKREEQLYAEFERKQQELYANYPDIYKKPPAVRESVNNKKTGVPQVINEEVILENVLEYIKENFVPIIEETMKDTIMEMYAVERIKQVINENTDIIEKIVISTLRKIQEQNKKKLQEQKK